jgi:hypothetical protein
MVIILLPLVFLRPQLGYIKRAGSLPLLGVATVHLHLIWYIPATLIPITMHHRNIIVLVP